MVKTKICRLGRIRCLMLVAVVALTAVHMGARPSNAGEARDFHKAVANAYGHYREAFFYVRRDNAAVAAFELESLAGKWRTVMGRFAGDPPDIYAANPEPDGDGCSHTQAPSDAGQ